MSSQYGWEILGILLLDGDKERSLRGLCPARLDNRLGRTRPTNLVASCLGLGVTLSYDFVPLKLSKELSVLKQQN